MLPIMPPLCGPPGRVINAIEKVQHSYCRYRISANIIKYVHIATGLIVEGHVLHAWHLVTM